MKISKNFNKHPPRISAFPRIVAPPPIGDLKINKHPGYYSGGYGQSIIKKGNLGKLN